LEVGTSNVFFFWRNEQGEDEVITPVADDTILHGCTRDSVLHLLRNKRRFKVTERILLINEVIKAIDENRMYEAFGTGTAVTISPINMIGFKGKDYQIPIDKELNAGKLSSETYNDIIDI